MKFYLIFITFIICILGASYKDYPQGLEPLNTRNQQIQKILQEI